MILVGALHRSHGTVRVRRREVERVEPRPAGRRRAAAGRPDRRRRRRARRPRAARARRSRTHRCAGRARRDGCEAATPAELTIVRDGRTRTRRGHARATTPRPSGRCSASASAPSTIELRPRRRRADRSVDGMWEVTSATVERDRPALLQPRGARRGLAASSAPTRRRGRAFERRHRRRRCSILGAHLAVAGDRQPLPVPAARRRPHLLGARREGARPGDPVRGRWNARASSASCSSSLLFVIGLDERRRPTAATESSDVR